MKTIGLKLTSFVLVLIVLNISGCIEGKLGKLRKTNRTTKEALRQQWTDYIVYYKTNTALLYQIKNEMKMIMPDDWAKVTSGEMMAESTIHKHTALSEILDHNKELIGYIVYRVEDLVSVTIIDEKTVRLYYERHVIQTP